MKKIFALPFLILLAGCTSNSTLSLKLDEKWTESKMPFSNSAVCTLKMSAVGEVNEWNLEMSTQIDKNPMKLSFGNLNTETPVIIWNNWDQSELLKIDNGSFIYLLEKTDVGNLNVFTFFRDKNIMTLSKQYDLFGKPFSLLMIWDCLAGSN
jgi:hypothetical protein